MSQIDQQILDAFGQPGFYPHPVDEVEHLTTHISHIFLAGDWAYKLKKPVDFGFLDFSTLDDRLHYCLQELELNRRLAPSLYKEVLAIHQDSSSPQGLSLALLDQPGSGPAREYCLKMARMEQERMMDALLDRDEVGPEQIRELAQILSGFYQKARRGPEVDFFGRPEQIRINVEENFRQTQSHQEVTVAPARWRAIQDYSLRFIEDNWDLFLERIKNRSIVDGHGDLHSGNINLPKDDAPLIFDCIEFNERFRYQDAACDLAFLAMDLDFHGREDLSQALMEHYVKLSGDRGVLELLDFYKCYRAVVRAKIHGISFDDQGSPQKQKFTDINKARRYFRLAARYTKNQSRFFLVCFMGLMGTGKSYLARHLAAELGWLYLGSDLVRKRLAGVPSDEKHYAKWGEGLYSPDATEETYQAMAQGAEAILSQGGSVVLDASFSNDKRRRAFLQLAQQHGAQPLFVEVWASEKVVRQRLAKRQARGDNASDGRLELMKAQAKKWHDSDWLLDQNYAMKLDGGAPLEEKLGMLLTRLREMGLTEAKHKA